MGSSVALSTRFLHGGVGQRRWAEFPHLLDEFRDDFSKSRTFRRRDPFEHETFGVDARKVEELFHEVDSLDGHVITIQVMAIADVSAAYEDAVSAFLKGLQNLMRSYRS